VTLEARVGTRGRRSRVVLFALFVVLLAALAAGLWRTVVRPSAYEFWGEVVARAAPGVLLVRHGPLGALGMGTMETMAVDGDPALIERSGARAGDRVRLAVRPEGDRLVILRIERVP
jgi:hypothetical protein